MRAVVFQGVGEPLTVEEVDAPTCPPHGVVVETEACGICRSDWHAWQGDWDWVGVTPKPGQIFGHEPVGIIAEVGEEVTQFSEGDRVTTPFNLSDGTCPHCRAGRANICENIVPLGFVGPAQGAFAERFTIPDADHNAVLLPEGVDPTAVAALGCRFATAFHGLAHRVDVAPGDWVAVHGCGGVGLSAVHIAAALGANVVAVDIGADKLDRARELGAHETVNATDADSVPREIKRRTGGGAHVSVDALGIAETCRNSVNCLVKGGQHLQIGLTTSEERGEIALPIDAIAMGEKEIYGAFGMQPNRYDEVFRMIASGSVNPGKIVSETVSLDEVPEKLAALGTYEPVGIPVVDTF
ncbi:zinc-dependent alcohol dehydrogenase family protein [Haladaptatus sp. DYSN1]|uniref:zinc-dependent alcohol dehydrogenase family protein n=1 Tax=unclassified Haladaptatus TaxID=2622732 RepID=UPI002405E73B|nr:zinc-dependent alcohol dehydrogenase family protein [Haladaptatus sp. DYSN1]